MPPFNQNKGYDMEAKYLPKTVQKYADKIRYWDDERWTGNSLIVELAAGWCLDARESHVFGVDNVAQAVSDLKRIQSCDCERCVRLAQAA